MNTYTTFNITTETTPNKYGKPHCRATVFGNGEEMETFIGSSMRDVLVDAADFIKSVVDYYCEGCANITDGNDESFRNCGYCYSCYDKMMAHN